MDATETVTMSFIEISFGIGGLHRFIRGGGGGVFPPPFQERLIAVTFLLVIFYAISFEI